MNTLMKRTNGNELPATTFSGLVGKIFQNNTDRIFDDRFWGFTNLERNVQIPVNIRETDKSFELELVAPGMKKEDFKVNLAGDTLTVSYEHKDAHSEQNDDKSWVRKEYKQQSFQRSFTLDESLDPNGIAAHYTDGILKLTVPKKPDAQSITRNIEIQ